MKIRFLPTLALLFHVVVSLFLIVAVVFYRTAPVSAQDGAIDEEAPALVPRSAQVADDDDDESDGDGAEPPTDDDGHDTPTPTDTDGAGNLQSFVFTVRPGDTLSHIALYLGVPLETLAAQVDNPSLIFPGQTFTYLSEHRIDTPPLFTDNDGTDSDGVDTTPATTDNDGVDTDGYNTPVPTDSDGYNTPATTDNDGTDSDGYDTPAPTDNDTPVSSVSTVSADSDSDDSDDSD